MSYIFQTVRVELDAAVRRHTHFLKGRILDVGAGSYNRYGSYFKAAEYVRMNMELGPGTQLTGRAEKIPVANAEFDGIVCTQVLGDIFDVRKALAEFNRVLKVGGRVLLTESLIDPLHDEPHDYWRFTRHAMQRLFEEAGFKVLALERVGGYFSTMAQLRTRYTIEKHSLYTAWYSRAASFLFKLKGKWALWRDARDESPANKLFAQGWIIVAEKK